MGNSLQLVGMKESGYYDNHSGTQAQVIERVLPLVEAAAAALPHPPATQPVVIVDYGCSEGRNSIRITEHAAQVICKRRPDESVAIYFNDLFTNNFNTLFKNLATLQSDRDFWAKGSARAPVRSIYEFAVGGSFYAPVMPPRSTHFALSTTSVHWLSQCPEEEVPEHIIADEVTGPARQPLAVQAARDWATFLECRACELVPGGKLLVTVLGRHEGSRLSTAPTRLLEDAVRDLMADGRIPRDKFAHMMMPIYSRTLEEVLAPLLGPLAGRFAVDHAVEETLPCPFHAEYLRSGNARHYAADYVGFIRAFSEPAIARGLFGSEKPGANKEAIAPLVNALYQRMEQRVIDRPEEYQHRSLQVFLLATRAAG